MKALIIWNTIFLFLEKMQLLLRATFSKIEPKLNSGINSVF